VAAAEEMASQKEIRGHNNNNSNRGC
jgi:hypothetical protein